MYRIRNIAERYEEERKIFLVGFDHSFDHVFPHFCDKISNLYVIRCVKFGSFARREEIMKIKPDGQVTGKMIYDAGRNVFALFFQAFGQFPC